MTAEGIERSERRPREVAVRVVGAVKEHGRGATAVRALDGVCLDLGAGGLTAIMGPSGSGKSTLLHCMAGLDRLDRGTISIGGDDLASLSERALTRLRRDRLGFVFQAFNLVPAMTARENILLPLTLARRRAEPGWLRDVVDLVGLGDRLSHRPSELSGGQQQRVALARALITRPEIVYADEPTGNLDSNTSAEILGFLRRTVDETGQTIALVTHDPGAAAHADRVILLADGRIVDELVAPTHQDIVDLLVPSAG